MKCMIVAPAHPDHITTDASASAYALFDHLQHGEPWDTLFVAAQGGRGSEPAPRPIARHQGRAAEYLLALPPIDPLTLCSTEPDRAFEILDRVIDLLRPDIIHLHNVGGLGLSVIPHLRARGIKAILTLHDSLLLSHRVPVSDSRQGNWRPSERLVRNRLVAQHLGGVDVIVAPTNALARQHIDERLVLADRVTVLRSPFGIRSNEARPGHSVGSKRPSFMAVVEADDDTAFRTLLGAARELEAEGNPPRIDVFGLYQEGEVEQLAPGLGEGAALRWGGFHDLAALTPRIAGYSGLILPSAGSSSHYLAYQAMLQSTPVLVEDARGMSDILKSPDRGLVFDAGSGFQLARLIKDVEAGEQSVPRIDVERVRDEDALSMASYVSLYRALKVARR